MEDHESNEMRHIPIQDQEQPATPAPTAGDPQAAASEVAAEASLSTAEIEDLRRRAAERDEIENRLKRVAADFSNAQKRLEREARNRVDYAVGAFLREVLAITDNLDRALDAAEKSRDLDSFLQGIRLADRQFHDLLARHQVERIAVAQGQPFDPELHEVAAMVPRPEQPAFTVVEEAQRGFRMKDRVLRPAKVVVAAPAAKEPPAESSSPS
jgi:molecular chaperone GrpE